MSDAADRLARSRLAILQQLERRERRRDGRDDDAPRAHAHAEPDGEPVGAKRAFEENRDRGHGWFESARRAADTWWRHHPAHMAVELATPMLSNYARRKPVQFLGIAALTGAVVMAARPWKLVSATGLVVALLKSSQLSGLVMSAMAGADFGQDRPPWADHE